MNKIAIIGAGNVGATCAYTILLSGIASEIVLIDANRARAEGEAMDLDHATPFTYPTDVLAGDYGDCRGADIIIIAAGAAQKPGETRLDLIKKNGEIFRQIIPKAVEHNSDGIILVVTNPVDVLTYVAWKSSGYPSQRVIGSGTILDTARFRFLLSQYYGVDPRSVHAHIIGEHGDSEVPVWSLANVAGMRLPAICEARGIGHDQKKMDELFFRTRDAAYHIIERKGATYYAIAACVMTIVRAIVRDQKTMLPVSTLIEDYYGISDICLSLPSLISGAGVEWVLRLELSEEEIESLRKSASVLKATIAQLAYSGSNPED